MGQPSVQVDIPGLARVGGAVTAVSPAFRAAWTSHVADLAVGTGLDGWATGASLDQAATAWQAFTGNLAEQVRTYGEGLTTAANELRASDQAAADRVTGAGRQPR